MTRYLARHALLTSALLAACDGTTPAEPPITGPYTVTVATGDGQSVIRGTSAPEPFVVQVRDAAGRAAPGVSVTWAAPHWTKLDGVEAISDAGGYARARWQSTCNFTAASFSATVSDGGSPSVATFTVTSATGPLTALFAPDSTRLVRGETIAVVAEPRDACGPLSAPSAGPLAWSVSNPAMLSLADTGATSRQVAGVTSGRAFVIARSAAGFVDSMKVAVHAPVTGMRTLAVTPGFGCALDGAGDVHCWGALGTITNAGADVAGARRIVTGYGFTAITAAHNVCALDGEGAAYCWGQNTGGDVGDGTTTPRATPIAVGGALRFSTISSNWGRTCALTVSGEAYCWGENASGQLGDGTTTDRLVPTPVATTLRFTQLATAAQFTCALTGDGATWCWGSGPSPWGGFEGQPTPVPTMLAGAPVLTQLAGGYMVMCGLTPAGAAYCWGAAERYWDERLLTSDAVSPRPVEGGRAYASITVGNQHACAVTPGGEVDCWGGNQRMQLGSYGGPAYRISAGAVTLPPMQRVFAPPMGYYTCGIGTDGAVTCWGQATAGLDRPGSRTCTSSGVNSPYQAWPCSAPRLLPAAMTDAGG